MPFPGVTLHKIFRPRDQRFQRLFPRVTAYCIPEDEDNDGDVNGIKMREGGREGEGEPVSIS